MANWNMVVSLVRAALGEGPLAEESMWKSVVLIPKGRGEYQGIGLVEVVWKVVAAILNYRLTDSINYHNFLHGFWTYHGTGTANLKAKLLQKLASMREEVLYVILLYLKHSYDSLYRYRCLEILEGYLLGTWSHCILRYY